MTIETKDMLHHIDAFRSAIIKKDKQASHRKQEIETLRQSWAATARDVIARQKIQENLEKNICLKDVKIQELLAGLTRMEGVNSTKDNEIKNLREQIQGLEADMREIGSFMYRVRDRKRPRTEG
jgi:septal ring factor EnvC (AmiA/AmiB activator)